MRKRRAPGLNKAVPRIRVGLFLCLITLCTSTIRAAPNITTMSVRGLQIGATTKITIQGSDLIPAPELVTSIPIAKQVVLEKPAINRIEMEVTLAEDVTPGVYNLRIANKRGISPAVIVAADRLPQVTFGAKIESLPAAIHGTVAGSNIAKTVFTGTKDQQITIDVEAARIGGKLRPVLHLYDARRRQIAWSLPNPSLAGDTRLTTALPADGDYTIELHDLQYAAPAPNYFRIKVGTFQYADMVFPPAVERGKTARIGFVGNIPADQQIDLDFQSLEDFGSLAPAPWPNLATVSGIRPKLLISNFPELVETPPIEGIQQLPSIPVAVSGRLDAPGQIDKYSIAVTEGAKLRFEVFADRIGSPIDSLLEIKNDKGGRLGLNDDTAGTTDSLLDYTVAKGVSVIHVEIKDQVDRATAESIYRLAITPLDDAAKRPGFILAVTNDTHNVPRGSTRVLQVTARRQNYNGPIKIHVDGLPPGIAAAAPDIVPNSNATLLTITGVGETGANILTKIRGTSVDLDPPISAIAAFDKHPLGKTQPWMQNDVALAIAPANNQPFQVDWSKSEAETLLALGTTFKAPVKFTRPPGAIGPVRLSVIVSEPVPVVNNRADVNRAVRAERATVDIAIDAKAKAAFDALTAADKALADTKTKAKAKSDAQAKLVAAAEAELKAAMAGQPADWKVVEAAQAKLDAARQAAADANAAETAAVKVAETKQAEAKKNFETADAAIKNDAEFNVIVPPNFDPKSCDLAIKAELRSLDNRTVLAEVYTPVRRFVPLNPLVLNLAGEPMLETRLDPKAGTTVKLSGTIERKAGFNGDVTVSIVGQPGGVAVPKVVLKPDKNDYALELKFPANFKPAEVKSIKLFATGPPDKTKANIVVRAEVPITVHVLAANPAELGKE